MKSFDSQIFKIPILSALGSCFLVASATAGTLLAGPDGSCDSGEPASCPFFLVDTETGAWSEFGATAWYGPEVDVAADGSTIYLMQMWTADSIHYLSQHDSVDGSFISRTPLSLTNALPPYPEDDEGCDWETSDEALVVTAMEPVGSTMYVSWDCAGPESFPGRLGTIDVDTGEITDIGSLSTMISPAGGLAYHEGTMYAVGSADSEVSELHSVDLSSGATTKIADITLGGEQAWAITALAVVDGQAYVKTNRDRLVGGNAGSIDKTAIYSLDLGTGALTEAFTQDGTDYGFASLTNFDGNRSGLGPSVPVPVLPPSGLLLLCLLTGMGLTLRVRNRT